MKLTHTHLIAAGMPPWDVNKFKLEWPDGCEITPENYARAVAIGLGPRALFAAICPTKELMDKWYKGHVSCYSEESRIRKQAEDELKQKLKMLEEEYALKERQHYCDLICEAMTLLKEGA